MPTSHQIQARFFLGSSASSVTGDRGVPGPPTIAPAWVPMSAVAASFPWAGGGLNATVPSWAIAGTATVAAATSPRRSACAARARFAAVAGRSAGFFAMQDSTRADTGAGMSPGSAGGCSLMCAIAIATCDSPVKGRRPASASYATMPSE